MEYVSDKERAEEGKRVFGTMCNAAYELKVRRYPNGFDARLVMDAGEYRVVVSDGRVKHFGTDRRKAEDFLASCNSLEELLTKI